jgi:uncharacterized membrane protein
MMVPATKITKFVAFSCLLVPASCFLAACSRAPSVDLVGSFFPAWLVCLVAAVLLTALTQVVLTRFHMKLAYPALAYPAIATVFTFLLWLIFFH